MVKKIIKFLIIVVILSVIFSFSNETGDKSTKRSDGLIIKVSQLVLNRKLTTKEKKIVVEKLVIPVRKTAHIIVYLLLGISIISFYKEFTILKNKDILICTIICLILAILDEIHQLFIIGRSGEVKDVFIDTFGSLIGILSYYKLSLKGRKKHE